MRGSVTTERGIHRLSLPHALPNEPRHTKHHRMAQRSRGAVVGRETQACFQVDRTGLGEGLATLLTQRFGEERIISFRFSRPSKSHLTYQLLAMINSGRLKMYQRDEAPAMIAEEVWKQLRVAKYRIAAPEAMDMDVEPGEGHDDFLMSTALLTEALASFTAPPESGYVRPRALYEGESQY